MLYEVSHCRGEFPYDACGDNQQWHRNVAWLAGSHDTAKRDFTLTNESSEDLQTLINCASDGWQARWQVSLFWAAVPITTQAFAHSSLHTHSITNIHHIAALFSGNNIRKQFSYSNTRNKPWTMLETQGYSPIHVDNGNTIYVVYLAVNAIVRITTLNIHHGFLFIQYWKLFNYHW